MLPTVTHQKTETMQTQNEIKEMLRQAFEAGTYREFAPDAYPSFEQWYDSNILNQAEPETVTNNKGNGKKCPKCRGTGKDGHDREYPPNWYICDKCDGKGHL